MPTGSRKWSPAEKSPQTSSHSRSEELRYALDYIHAKATESRTLDVYQPGDISYCRASIIRVFYDYLKRLGYSSSNMDYGAKISGGPPRYCLVNRHLGGSQYEVYILTTFRNAQSIRDIPWMGQYFSIPMGSTRSLSNVAPVSSHPPFFGEKSASFLFAIPTRQTLHPGRVIYRVPHSELHRITKHSRDLTMELPKHQRLLRDSVKDMYWGEAKWGGDDFALAPSAARARKADKRGSVKPSISRMRTPVFKIFGEWKHYQSNNLSWVLRDTRQDFIEGSSNYLAQIGLTRSRHISLKPPYYAQCLRLSSSRIMQLIR